jgi:hypothetical protein
MVVLLETSATAAREYGGVPFHFANDDPGPHVRSLQGFRLDMAMVGIKGRE